MPVETTRPHGRHTDPVAIVGVSFRLPRCADWTSLTEVLSGAVDCVRPLPADRAAATRVRTTADDKSGGWLDDITGFDHRYFGVSRGEAELIDPRQRLMVQLATEAVGNAGYSPVELRGRNVAVLVAAHGGPHTGLYDLLPPASRGTGMAFAGNLHAFAAGRISYHLDLRGPAQAIDTACSSFLVALHEARHKLARGECELALVGGGELVLGQPPRRVKNEHGLGVESAGDRCRPFDAAADGAGFGEGGGFVLLKPLSAAVADGDVIHAVVLGSAVNQDGGQANGLTAPSPRGQADVLTAAWADAGIDADDISYVEAHGTGTRIGDPIEIQGLAEAFARSGRTATCLISSVKGSFGHLSGMAGFAGLLRVIAQFRAERIFPTAHFHAPNPLLHLDRTPIEVAHERTGWPADRQVPRIAGISGFGLSGTNAHLVVSDYAPHLPTAGDQQHLPTAGDQQHLPTADGRQHVSADGGRPGGGTVAPAARQRPVVVSARDAQGLRTVLTGLRQRLREIPADEATFAAVTDVLMFGREHFGHRWAAVAGDAAQLGDLIDRALPGLGAEAAEPSPVVLSLGDTCEADLAELEEQADRYPGIARVLDAARAISPPSTWSAARRHVVALAARAAVLTDTAVPVDLVLSHGAGTAVARWVRDEQDLATTLRQAEELQGAPDPDPDRLDLALRSTAARVVVDLTPDTTLSTLLAPRVVAGGGAVLRGSVSHLLAELHRCGHRIDWTRVTGRHAVRRIELPVAPPAAECCWPETVADGRAPDEAPAEQVPAAADLSPADFVLAAARELLKEPGLAVTDDFFDAGGNSLNGTQLVNRVNEQFGTALDVMDLFDTASFADLAERVAAAARTGPGPRVDPVDGPGSGQPPSSAPLSGQQAAIWAATELGDDSPGAYHVPAAILLPGEPPVDALTRTLTDLVERQPMLRCGLERTDGEVRQVVHPVPGVVLEHRELDLRPSTADEGGPALLAALQEMVARPMPLYATAPARFELVRVHFADRTRNVLLLTFHHLFFDGWSWRLVLAVLGGAPVPTPRRHYFDYVAAQRLLVSGARGRELASFWAGYLRHAPGHHLPVGSAVTAPADLRGASLPLDLPEATVRRLRATAQAERVSTQMLLFAAWVALLWQVSGARDHCVAMPVAGRQPADESTVGCYVNTVLVRVAVDPGEPLARLLAAVRDSSLEAIAHADLPTDEILRLGRSASGGPIVPTMFDYQSGVDPIERSGPDGPGMELLDLNPPGAKYPLNVTCLEYGDHLHVRMEYSAALFDPSVAEGWLDTYATLLGQVAETGTTGDLFALFGTPVVDVAGTALPEFRF